MSCLDGKRGKEKGREYSSCDVDIGVTVSVSLFSRVAAARFFFCLVVRSISKSSSLSKSVISELSASENVSLFLACRV